MRADMRTLTEVEQDSVLLADLKTHDLKTLITSTYAATYAGGIL
jgi:hypothetical protein